MKRSHNVIIKSQVQAHAVKGLRDLSPSSYSLKMESLNTLLKSTHVERYQSRPFSVGGYKRTLVVYPNGNKKDNGAGYLSLYVAIDNSTFVGEHKDVYVDLRFYIFNKNERHYFTIQDIYQCLAIQYFQNHVGIIVVDIWYGAPGYGYSSWGDSEFISLADLNDSSKGFVVNDTLMVQVEMESISLTKYFP